MSSGTKLSTWRGGWARMSPSAPLLRLKFADKAGVHHLSRAMSLEWASQGVTVNVVAPCITETATRKVILERPGYKEWANTQMLPAGRWNQPEDLVGAVLFLSSHLSDMVVGHVLMVDGGWTIH